MVAVEGGTYTMGLVRDETGLAFGTTSGTRVVTLSDFLIGKYEVTRGRMAGGNGR